MRLVTYRIGSSAWQAGIVVGEQVLAVTEVAAAGRIDVDTESTATVRGLLAAGVDPLSLSAVAVSMLADAPDLGDAVADIELGPPLPDPDKIICVGLNYRAHVQEVAEELPAVPSLFPKFRNGLIGHEGEVLIDAGRNVDYEGELAVVIGRRCSKVSAEEAPSYLAGCTVLNDVSARDLQFLTTQWTAGKIPDTFAPCGPWLVTMDEIPDLQGLRIETRLNGEVVQAASTAEMVFTVAQLVAYISSFVTLVPGDIIATGTPSGVGMGQEPPNFMTAGDTVEIAIERVGTLRNQLVEGVGRHLVNA